MGIFTPRLSTLNKRFIVVKSRIIQLKKSYAILCVVKTYQFWVACVLLVIFSVSAAAVVRPLPPFFPSYYPIFKIDILIILYALFTRIFYTVVTGILRWLIVRYANEQESNVTEMKRQIAYDDTREIIGRVFRPKYRGGSVPSLSTGRVPVLRLICGECHAHNGLSPSSRSRHPFRCFNCNFLNDSHREKEKCTDRDAK